jgi:transcriptional antiterminator RfaH
MTDMIAPAERSWFVVNTHPHREVFAAESLSAQDFGVYCPKVMKHVRHARRAYDAPRPLFPGYLFVELGGKHARWRPILGTFGVRSVIRHGNAPALLPVGFVENLKAREMEGVIRRPEAPFRTGQRVAVSGGPFDGVIGQIIELRDRDRVLVLLDLLNQKTKLHIEAKMLRSL